MNKMDDKIYTEDEAYALTRKVQCNILKFRDIEYKRKDKEADLIYKIMNSNDHSEKILDSNPKKKVVIESKETLEVKEKPKVDGIECERCGTTMIKTGAGHSGIDYHCDSCGLNSTIGR